MELIGKLKKEVYGRKNVCKISYPGGVGYVSMDRRVKFL